MLRIIKILFFSLTIVALLTLMGFIMIVNNEAAVKEINVNIFRNSPKGFLSEEIILKSIHNLDTIDSLTVKDINLSRIEDVLVLNPYIKSVDSYITLDGKLTINIEEKDPVLRIYNKDGLSIYIDNYGDFVPLSNRFTPRVLVASGYIDKKVNNLNSNIFDTTYNNTYMRKVFYLYSKIANNKFLNSQIGQIYVNSKGEYDLVPLLGEHLVKLGPLENIDEKLINLEAYYRKNLTIPDWDKYRTINLTYRDQIVCTKK